MPDQGTLLRSFLAVGILFGLPMAAVAFVRLRQSSRERSFLLASGVAAALFGGGLLWLLLLLAPPAVPCPPQAAGSESACAFDSPSLHRGWPLVDVALAGLVGLGLAVAMAVWRWRREATVSIEELLQDVLARDR